jgi:iron complex transport system substrate-binding protein
MRFGEAKMIRPGRLAVLCCALALAAGLWAGPAAARVVTDEMGRPIQVPAEPRRMVSLIASHTEALFALGLGDRVVGVSTWSDYPPRARELPKVGDYTAPNLERIVALRPDLVLATREGNPPWVVERLEALGIPVYVTVPVDPRRVPRELARLGEVCGAPAAGRRLAAELAAQFAEVDRRLEGAPLRRVLMVIGSRPLVSVSRGTMNHELIEMAHGLNVAADAPGPWPRLSLEFVIQARPQVVLLSTMERGQELAKALARWRVMPGVGDRPGVRVVSVNSDLIDRPGPRLGQGLQALARAIHPELFGPQGAGQ